MLSVRLPEAVERDLTQFCAVCKLTKSQVVQEALAEYLVAAKTPSSKNPEPELELTFLAADDPIWMPWSLRHLRSAKPGQLAINMVVYVELAGHPAEPAHVDQFLDVLGVQMIDLSRPAHALQVLPFVNTANGVAPKPRKH